MKKLSLFLAVLMLVTTIVSSCAVKTEESGTQSDVSQESSVPANSTPDEVDIIPQYETNVSFGKSYTPSHPAAEAYPDTFEQELTDGVNALAGGGYSDPKFAGWNVDGLNIIIDLGEVMDKLYKFEVSYLSTKGAGVAPLASGSVAYSEDGEKFTSIGSVKVPEFEDKTIQKAVVESKKYIKARYIKFTLRRGAAWLFLDELSVYADILDESKNIKYLDNIFEAYNNDKLTNAQRVEALNAVSNALADRSKVKILASKEKSYTLSRPSFNDEHSDDGKKLTDAASIGAFYESGRWVGFTGTEALDITVDLEKVFDDLSDFEISFFNNINVGISSPDSVTIFVSEDNKSFTEVGRVYGPSERVDYYYNISLKLTYGVKGRYVKFAVAGSGFAKYFIEETAVYRYGSTEETKDALYPDIVLPKITKEEFWSASSADYTKKQNLILGRKPQIISALPMPASASKNNSLITDPTLTDGKYSTSNDIHGGMFFKFNQGAYREVVFDLEKTSSVSGFAASFVSYKSWAVNAPPLIKYYLSDDGESWYLAGQSTAENTDTVEIKKAKIELKTPLKARFVRFSFAVETWAGCDELEVIGTKQVGSATKPLSSLGVAPNSFLGGDYLKPSKDVLGGAKDIMLSYHCSYAANKTDPTVGLTTVEQYMPYVAYVDKNGKIVDIMFDGFLFLPSNSAFPSGGLPHKDSVKSDWIYVLDNLFAENFNMDALNQAAQKVKDELKLDKNYKYQVYTALIYPTMGLTFGDMDGDGKADKLNTNQDRIDAVKWFIDEFYKRFNAGNYENLEFSGFYWHHESMEKDNNEIPLLKGVSDYVHAKNSQFFWIPYFLANGYSRYEDYGFDFACMQPNYAFEEEVPLSNIETTAIITKAYNMCVEMEIDSKAITNSIFYKRWMDYLKGGVYYGYIDALHMYYQGGMPGAFYLSATSKDVKERLVYDYTYDFIKNQLKLVPDKRSALSFDAEKDKAFLGSLNNAQKIEITEYALSLSPQNGTVTINSDGSFIYYPNKGFTGTDTFLYQYSEQLDYSEPCEVTITVK